MRKRKQTTCPFPFFVYLIGRLLRPNWSKYFFNARSVRRIVPSITRHCTRQIDPPTHPIVSISLPINGSIAAAEIGNIPAPHRNHSRPQYRLANIQVPRLFMDLRVRYPDTAFTFPGALLNISNPQPIIAAGITRSMTSIKNQKPMFRFLSTVQQPKQQNRIHRFATQRVAHRLLPEDIWIVVNWSLSVW